MARLARVPRAAKSGLGRFWDSLTSPTRRRLVVAVLGAIALLVLLTIAWPALPCDLPGGDACAPDDDAEELVPADTLAYVHLELDPDSDQFTSAAATAAELPGFSRQVVDNLVGQVPGPGGEPADFERDLAPWFGGQAAVALLPRGRAAEQVQLLEEGDAELAAEFAAGISGRQAATTEYDGIEVRTGKGGLATASVQGFLVIGTQAGVRSVIDASTGADGATALADDSLAGEVRDELPGERFVTAYLSERGTRRLISSPRSPLAPLEPFVDVTATRGAAVSLGSAEDSIELAVRSELDPAQAEDRPGFFAAFPRFEPNLPDVLGSETLAYMGIADPATTVSSLLEQAAAESPALAAGVTAAAERLADLGEVDLEKDLLAAFGGETAIALQPGVDDAESEDDGPGPALPEGLPSGPAPLPTGQESVPVIQFLAEGVDTQEARQALARLQGPISKALDPGIALQAPVFETREVDGVELQILRLGPTLNLTYALLDGRLAVASQPSAVEQVISGDGGLADEDSFAAATDDLAADEEVSMLVFLDLAGLINLGERQGLAESAAYAELAPDLGRLDAAALAVDAQETAIATDLRLVIERSKEPVDDR